MMLKLFIVIPVYVSFVMAEQRHGLNGKCLHVNDCNRIGYFCSRNRTCQCGPGYTQNHQWTKCLGFIGSRCIYDSQCIDGAYCTNFNDRYDSCQCREQDDFFPNEDSTYCINSKASKGLSANEILILFIFIPFAYV